MGLFDHILDVNSTVRQLRKKADKGNPEAITALGTMYLYGTGGLERNLDKAKEMFADAVSKGNSTAMVNLGSMYQNGQGVPRDLKKAKELFEKAVELDNISAMNNLGWMYQHGVGALRDSKKARALYEAASAKGNASAKYNLAIMHKSGSGGHRDLVKAHELFTAAAQLGDSDAMVQLGMLYENGEGVPTDINKAREFYEQAVAKKNENGKKQLDLLKKKYNLTMDDKPQNKRKSAKIASAQELDAIRNPQPLQQPNAQKTDLNFKYGNNRIFPQQNPLNQTTSPILSTAPSAPSAESEAASRTTDSDTVVIEGYGVVKTLGAGGFGKVFLVRKQSTSHSSHPEKTPTSQPLFAMKLLRTGNDKEKVNKALREAWSGSFNHPSIVKIDNCFLADILTSLGETSPVGAEEQHVCIVMEFCEGGDLRSEILRMIQQDRKCEEQVAWMWLYQACSALELVHSKNMIHRDIKPENILLTADSPPCIKLTDFGISRILMDDESYAQTQIGTSHYAAPDIAATSGYGESVDMWGIGVVFYELLTRNIRITKSEISSGVIAISRLRPENSVKQQYWQRVSAQDSTFAVDSKNAILKAGYSNELAEVVCNLMLLDKKQRRTAKQVADLIKPTSTASPLAVSESPTVDAQFETPPQSPCEPLNGTADPCFSTTVPDSGSQSPSQQDSTPQIELYPATIDKQSPVPGEHTSPVPEPEARRPASPEPKLEPSPTETPEPSSKQSSPVPTPEPSSKQSSPVPTQEPSSKPSSSASSPVPAPAPSSVQSSKPSAPAPSSVQSSKPLAPAPSPVPSSTPPSPAPTLVQSSKPPAPAPSPVPSSKPPAPVPTSVTSSKPPAPAPSSKPEPGSSSRTVKKPFEIQFKDLKMTKWLGQGGFGVVWLGKWCGKGGGQEVAIKTLTASKPNPATLSHEALAEFESKMETMSSLCHFNIARIFGACIDNSNTLCIVGEHAEHGSLFDVLHDSSIKLEWWLRWRMAKQLVMGLNYLHSLEPEILHCHVKSNNVLVADRWNIRICDTGLTKVREETARQLLMGSSKDMPLMNSSAVRWRAPETMGRHPAWSTKSDVYSMGMVMWEIITRNIPFHDVIDDASIPIIVRMDGARPEIPDSCPAPLADIIKRCWTADPNERPSCDVLLEEMQDYDEQFEEQ